MGELKRNQKRALAALLEYPSIRAAAKAARVGERTLHTWMKEDPNFQQALKDAQDAVLKYAITRAATELPRSIAFLAETRDNESVKPSTRVNAASRLPAVFVSLAEVGDLVERLEAIEEALKNQ